jgi:UDP-N-acetylmuramoyl-tripeptide--D-alanyl-D-alanine ligase
MNRPLKWVAAQLGQVSENDAQVTGWSVDSRTLRPGDLFFALRGPTHDGNAYVAEVLKNGAAGAIVDQGIDGDHAVLRVQDSLVALQTLASSARREWAGDVVGVTGSAGKTTTKDVIAELLSEGFKTAKTEGNLNNHVGLPLSLLRLDDHARIAVLEMGMNHSGEIRALAEISRPNLGVVTNVGAAHMESFDSIEGIAAAKRELIEALPLEGTAVLNADDARVAAFATVHAG